jgi:hypothetical protein
LHEFDASRFIQDWKRHKKLCKPDTETQQVQSVSSSTGSTPCIIDENIRVDGSEAMIERTDGKELIIEVPARSRPGGKMNVASTTWSPAYLKELRNYFERDEGSPGSPT